MWNFDSQPPNDNNLYIVTDGVDVKIMRRLETGYYQTAVFTEKWNNFGKIIAWMPLPVPPKIGRKSRTLLEIFGGKL